MQIRLATGKRVKSYKKLIEAGVHVVYTDLASISIAGIKMPPFIMGVDTALRQGASIAVQHVASAGEAMKYFGTHTASIYGERMREVAREFDKHTMLNLIKQEVNKTVDQINREAGYGG